MKRYLFFLTTTSRPISYDPNPQSLFTTASPIENPAAISTEEDQILFNNLTVLLFELIITVYREHLRLRHYTRR